MAEELTTAMHSEFMEGEISKEDLKILAVYGAVSRGLSLSAALRRYGITETDYKANIDRVLNS